MKQNPPMELSSVSAKTKVRHKTDINRTLATMPLASRRVLFMAIAQLDPRHLVANGQVFRIYASEYAKIAKVENNTAYEQLKAAALDLQKQVIGIPKEQLLPPIPRKGERPWVKPVGTGTRMLNITEYCDYEDGDGYIDLSFSRQMEPYICMIEGNFTTQVLLSSARLRDTNASNLYQLIRQKISEKRERYFDIGVDELKDELGLFTTHNKQRTYSYALFKDFNKVVLKRSIETIMDTTEIKDLSVEIIERKQRKATRLRFSYRVDDQMTFEGF
ncbi:replication initiation protein [Shewanella xiamenensis]|uniref:replication initiation protein n=1 Tax=Shewanella xiamenensis TaxID=332186 RepID=UPI00313A7FC6